jgi:resuscitation-promoting factor RpfB
MVYYTRPLRATHHLFTAYRRTWLAAVLLLSLLVACAGQTPEFAGTRRVEVTVTADGQTRTIETEATNVRELLEELRIPLTDNDEITPPPFTPLGDGLQVRIVRISESMEIMEQLIPFSRKVVRNEAMSVDDPPRIVQGGKTGLLHITVRITYRDGLEFGRQETNATVMEEALDEIVMIGVGAAPGNVTFAGTLAYVSGGNSVILRGSTAVPEQLHTGNDLDNRVFSLSPSGNYLLYSRHSSEEDTFNSLWLLSTRRGAEPQPLELTNVLWAEWNPSLVDELQIAYTTGKATDRLPGWEANNDLWLVDVFPQRSQPLVARQIVEAYPATYGWWGGNFAWSPNGRLIGYSYADEIGVVDTQAGPGEPQRVRLQSFTEYNTRADWVWVPSFSWSPDGRYLAYARPDVQPGVADTTLPNFDIWAVDVTSGLALPFAEQTGMWGHPHWSPFAGAPPAQGSRDSAIAYLRALNPIDSQRSSYTLWLVDRDGSNAQQLYPPVGENSLFAREQRFLTWGPTGRDMAFIYNNALYLFNLDRHEARRVTQDDAVVRNPTWAPYGRAIAAETPATQVVPLEIPTEPLDPAGPGDN